MDLPFTQSQFEQVFVGYNTAIWPVQLVAWLLGTAALLVALSGRAGGARIVFIILACLWGWTGIAYHVLYFTDINRAAYAFGAAFIAEAILFLVLAFRSPRPSFRFAGNLADIVSCALIAYGIVIYPLATLLWTHPYPATPMFGTTPCPTVIFTFGLLLLAKPLPPTWLFAVPALWALIGGSAAILLNVPEDWMLFAALASWIVMSKPWRLSGKSEPGGVT